MYSGDSSCCFLCGKEGHFKVNCPQNKKVLGTAPKVMPTFTNCRSGNRVSVWFGSGRLFLDEYWEKDDLYSRDEFPCSEKKLLEFQQAADPHAHPMGQSIVRFLWGSEAEQKGNLKALQSAVSCFVTKTEE